MHNTDSTWQ